MPLSRTQTESSWRSVWEDCRAPLWLLLWQAEMIVVRVLGGMQVRDGGVGAAWGQWEPVGASWSHLEPFGGYGEFGGPEADAGSANWGLEC